MEYKLTEKAGKKLSLSQENYFRQNLKGSLINKDQVFITYMILRKI